MIKTFDERITGMRRKEKIIIDRVDVSGCRQAIFGIKTRCAAAKDINRWLCSENPYCIFKQLEREKRRKKLYYGANKIENVFTIEHLRIAKMIAKGYDIEEIIKTLHYSKATICNKITDLYHRYNIKEKGQAASRKLRSILQEKLFNKKSLIN